MVSLTFSYVLLIFIAAAALVASVIASIYVLVYWSEKSEIWNTIIQRIFIVIGLTFVYFVPLVIPIDVSLSYLAPELTFMQIVWQVLLYIVIAFSVAVFPFVLFFMDEKLDHPGRPIIQILRAFKSTIIAVAGIVIIAVVLYYAIGRADVQYPQYIQPDISGEVKYEQSMLSQLPTIGAFTVKISAEQPVSVIFPLSFVTYFLAIFSFLGSIFFALFYAIGLCALPIDMINMFRKRPRVLNKADLKKFRERFAARSRQMILRIDGIYDQILLTNYGGDKFAMRADVEKNDRAKLFKKMTKQRREFEKLNRDTADIYEIYQEVLLMNQKETANPLTYFAKLVMGLICLLFSILLWSQLLVIVISRFLPNALTTVGLKNYFFLGTLMAWAQESVKVPLFSTLLFGICSLYTTFCFTKGVTKFGFRFIMFIPIHPMKIGKTELSSFIFNTLLMTIGILPMLQFLTYIFKAFSYGAAVGLLFSDSISNIQYLKVWFDWYIVVMVCLSVMTVLYLIICPGEDVHDALDALIKDEKAPSSKPVVNKKPKGVQMQSGRV